MDRFLKCGILYIVGEGDKMYIVEWLVIIFGIFFLLLLGIKLLLRSDQKLHASKKAQYLKMQHITKINARLDDMLVKRKSENERLEKVNKFFVKVNTQVFKK